MQPDDTYWLLQRERGTRTLSIYPGGYFLERAPIVLADDLVMDDIDRSTRFVLTETVQVAARSFPTYTPPQRRRRSREEVSLLVVPLYGALYGFLLSAVVGLALLISRRGDRTSQYPFGPLMILGAVIAVLTV